MHTTTHSPAILWDCHMHSAFSADSHTPAQDMVQQAIQIGLKGICFTEHLDPDYPDTPEKLQFTLDIPAYLKNYQDLKTRYQGQISIRFGIEIGLQPHLSGYFHKLLADYPFDYVIGSSHLIHGEDPYYPRFFQGKEEHLCYQEYFESILENLSAFSEMDSYGHLDYIVRYGPNQNRFYSYEKYSEILDKILTKMIQKQIALEINTGGYHYGLGQPNPCRQIIERYRQLGGEWVTIGADAHDPKKIGYDFPKAAQLLKDCGFSYYTVFNNRKPEFFKL